VSGRQLDTHFDNRFDNRLSYEHMVGFGGEKALSLTSVTVVIYIAKLSMFPAAKLLRLDFHSLGFSVMLLLFLAPSVSTPTSWARHDGVAEPAIMYCRDLLLSKVLRSMLNVIAGESRDEEVRVIVVLLVPHTDAFSSFLRRLLQLLRQELALLVEVVPSANVDQNIRIVRELGQQLRRIMRNPLILLVLAEVATESLLAPRAVTRVGDGRKSRDRLVHAGVLEEERESAVTAHGVAGDRYAGAVELFELCEEGFGKLVGNVAVHVIALVVRLFGRIDVEAGARTEVVALVFTLDVQAARRCVWVDDGDVVLCGGSLEEALLGAVVTSACEAGEVEEDRGGL
jgi:hypothetical protein